MKPEIPAESPSDPRSRRERKKERTRRMIYEAAMSLFARDGFDAVTIEQICREADVAKGTFFFHFATKAELLTEFGRLLADELWTQFEEPRENAIEELRTLVDIISQRLLEQAEVIFAMLRDFMTTPHAPIDSIEHGRHLRDVVENIVERGQKRGEFGRDLHPRLAATVFLTTAVSILSGAVFGRDEVTPEQAREHFLAIVLHGLAGRS